MKSTHGNLENVKPSEKEIENSVIKALQEDVKNGDLTALLIDPDQRSTAEIICRENSVLCGTDWVNKTFHLLDPAIEIEWMSRDGASLQVDESVCKISGDTRTILTGERTAINFLQTLSGTATITAEYVAAIKNENIKILDTRKTIPGLRDAQKYAVICGGGKNHRKGLYDGVLIKENHIIAAGSIENAVKAMQSHNPGMNIEVEVENAQQIMEAVEAKADIILLDNFSEELIEECLPIVAEKILIEVSGNLTIEKIGRLSKLAIDFISVGALTKNVQAVDFSLRLIDS